MRNGLKRESSWRELGEFGFIRKWIDSNRKWREETIVGPGDDGAVWAPQTSQVITTDLLIEEIDFRIGGIPPEALGRKLVSINLSDLAAMGAKPFGFLVSLAIPERISPEFFDPFREGVFERLARYRIDLLGGDVSRSPGPLVLNGTAVGEVVGAGGDRMLRSGARPGDRIYVTGTLGDAALGLELEKSPLGEEERFFVTRLHDPTPRVEVGVGLAECGLPTAMIDVSDGLLQDLRHILDASHCGAELWLRDFPFSEGYLELCRQRELSSFDLALSGGEDYELLFTVREGDQGRVEQLFERLDCSVAWIGRVTPPSDGVRILDPEGRLYSPRKGGFNHFPSP